MHDYNNQLSSPYSFRIVVGFFVCFFVFVFFVFRFIWWCLVYEEIPIINRNYLKKIILNETVYLYWRYPEHSNIKQTISYKSCDVVSKKIKVEANYTEKENIHKLFSLFSLGYDNYFLLDIFLMICSPKFK